MNEISVSLLESLRSLPRIDRLSLDFSTHIEKLVSFPMEFFLLQWIISSICLSVGFTHSVVEVSGAICTQI